MSESREAAERVARQLYAIASPVRLEILATLRLGGEQSVSDLARQVPDARRGIQATLRDMADSGWVKLESGTGRSATWSIVADAISWSDVDDDDPAVRAAQTAVEAAARQRRFSYIRAFEHEWQMEQWPREWSDAVVSRDYTERLTPSELENLEQAIHAAIVEIRERAAERRKTDPESSSEEKVFLTIMGFPRPSR